MRHKNRSRIVGWGDRNTCKHINITLWEAEADMRAREASSYLEEARAKSAHLVAGPPVTEHYEVLVQE